MAEDTKKGPVKPPIIDAKPSGKSDSEKPASAASTLKAATPSAAANKPSEQTKPTGGKPTPSSTATKSEKPKSGMPFGTLIIAALLGAALGTGATSFMASNGIAPFEKGTSTSQFNAAMETLQKRVFDLENAEKIDLSKFATTTQLDDFAKSEALSTANAQIKTLSDKIAALGLTIAVNTQNEAPAQTPLIDSVVVAKLQSEIDGLKTSILELSPDSAQNAEAQLEQNQKTAAAIAQISVLSQTQSVAKSDISSLKQQVVALSQTLSALGAKVDAQPTQLPATANLPLILDAWEKALSAEAPFADYVQSALIILPQLDQSDALLANAKMGVATISSLKTEFAALIPAFVKSDADVPEDAAWYDRFIAQAKSAIGLRPLDQTGSDPLAVVAQIEAALEQGNLRQAQTALLKLPEEWQNMAAEFAGKLSAKTAAMAQLDQARGLALGLATIDQGNSQ